ncbi:histidine kinase [Ferrovum sp.]|uniref:histidine kinase n=1 Tax=Ferrovum sp. TaxID=2609467 RepID=UPI0026187646|nr:histidine kinase [Ferrovum sp.]
MNLFSRSLSFLPARPWSLPGLRRRAGQTLVLRSLRQRLALSLALLFFLVLLGVLSAWRMTIHSSGEARLLNHTAAIRMQVWRLEVTHLTGDHKALAEELKECEVQLASLPLLVKEGLLPTDSPWPPLLLQAWPDLRAHLEAAPDPENRRWLAQALPAFTHLLDQVVHGLEQDLESSIQTLRWVQGATLLGALLLTLSIILHLQQDFFTPLKVLLRSAQAVQNGQFSARISPQPNNELGEVGNAFNAMVERLSVLYEGLEQRVAEKTRELQHSNHLLQLLYRTATRLTEGDLTQEILLEMLVDVERALDLGPGIVCVRREEDSRAYPLATTLPEIERAALCESLGCSICFGSGRPPTAISEHHVGAVHLVSIPLTGGGQWQGVMPFQILAGNTLQVWQAQILQTLAGHVATALANARRTEERHRLAVYEERAVIARELHDSLAQSLSYLKIQVSLLQTRLEPKAAPELQATVEELKTGLNSAYRELRELLTTFRLTPGQTPFTEELTSVVQEARRRCGFDILLEQRMNNLELGANEEIHLMRLIREALVNIERHAKATWARVTLEANSLRQVELCIEDNGQGWPATASPEGHFGLTIMRERAAFLKGLLNFDTRPAGGARITLTFIALTPYAAH